MQLSANHRLWDFLIQGGISSAGDSPDLSKPRIFINTHSVVLREIMVIRTEFLLIRGCNLSYRLNVGCIVNWVVSGRSQSRFAGR